jgi:hypothetical protein
MLKVSPLVPTDVEMPLGLKLSQRPGAILSLRRYRGPMPLSCSTVARRQGAFAPKLCLLLARPSDRGKWARQVKSQRDVVYELVIADCRACVPAAILSTF